MQDNLGQREYLENQFSLPMGVVSTSRYFLEGKGSARRPECGSPDMMLPGAARVAVACGI
jgi:hypothetical protein